jgi:hypothetical protein
MKKRSSGKARRPGDRKSVQVAVLNPQDDSLYHLYSVAFGARRARRGGREIAKQSLLLLLWFVALTGLCATFSTGKLHEATMTPPVTASVPHHERLSL